ncbi:hypothetical protein NDA10_006205 [Ustilago hordei]|nr:hypothetical protein NDA10_006205 [Ustilago hordei]
MALNVQGVSPRDLFLEAPQELLQPEMQLPQALAPQPSKCICTHCHKNLPITSVTPGSPTGPACISAPDPTPNPGLDTNFVMTTSLLEVQLQGVTNAITSSVMGPLRSLEHQHHTSPPCHQLQCCPPTLCQHLTTLFKPSQPSSVAAETASQPNIKARGTA